MNIKKNIFIYFRTIGKIFLLPIVFVQLLNAKDDPIKFSLGEYNFKAMYDTTNYRSTLTVNKKGGIIYSAVFVGRITSIKADNLNKAGQTNVFIDNFTGGAHCCFNLYIGYIENNNFILSDSLDLGNSGYEIKDLNDDTDREIISADDTFAYAFTNYAQSHFSPIVYSIENNKFINVTKNYPAVINASINELKAELKSYTDAGFACPENDTADTFNTDAGAVKAILAPVVADYFNLGEVQKGYDFINSNYNCPDKNKFIQILQNEYKLK